MSINHIPKPLKSGPLCSACRGTGADIEKTLKISDSDFGYTVCRYCFGNGLDPSEIFRWSNNE